METTTGQKIQRRKSSVLNALTTAASPTSSDGLPPAFGAGSITSGSHHARFAVSSPLYIRKMTRRVGVDFVGAKLMTNKRGAAMTPQGKKSDFFDGKAVQTAKEILERMPEWQKAYAEEIIESATGPESSLSTPLPKMLS
jgi:hypothetical protein